MFYLIIQERKRECAQAREGERGRSRPPAEQGARCGLHPRTLRSWPEPKANAQEPLEMLSDMATQPSALSICTRVISSGHRGFVHLVAQAQPWETP